MGEEMVIQDLTNAVGSYGFPIAITWFLLTKGTKVVADITTALNELTIAVKMLQQDREGGNKP